MAKITRFAFSNLLFTAGAVIVPDSELASMPRGNLLKPGTSKRLRFAGPWVITAGENDKIDFFRTAAPLNATIAAGTYATGALLAAAIVTALEAADSPPAWDCTYSAVTFKFTISSDLAFQLLFDTPNTFFEKSIHLDLGYTSTDKASATSHVAENVSYQSRHSLNVDLLTAQAFTAGIVRGHNISTAGTITLQADTATMIGVGLSDTTIPDFTQTLPGADPRVAYFASQTKRHLRLVIADVQNSVGFTELGIWWPGPHAQPTIVESINFEERYEPLSEIFFADGGAHHQVLRARRLVYTLNWEEIETPNIDIFRALNLAMPMGASFFLSLDAVDNPTTSTHYVFWRNPLHIPMVAGPYSNVGPLEFAEALG